MKYVRHWALFLMGIIILFIPSCDGIFEDIYDSPQSDVYGFLEKSTFQKTGIIYVNASAYTNWIYIDLHETNIDSMRIINGNEEYSGNWDLAVHRYDAKTNGGRAMETIYSDFGTFLKSAQLPDGHYIEDADTDSTIIVDMSNMMNGDIKYVQGKVNKKLSEWLNRDMSSMPPVYTLSNKIYVVELKDKTKAAVKLVNYMNNAYDKGYLTIEYVYPIEF